MFTACSTMSLAETPPRSEARFSAALGKATLKSALSTAVAAVTLMSTILSAGSARALQIRLIADNDWALFAGTSTTINRLVVQNNTNWPSQNFAQNVSDPLPGETTWWFLAMNAGGTSDAFGSIGSIANFANAPGIQVSNPMQSYLTGYNDLVFGEPPSLLGGYNASLGDVQTALPNLTFGNVNRACNEVCTTFSSVSGGSSLSWGSSTQAVLYRFAMPVPGPLPALGAAAAFGFSRKLRKRIKATKAVGASVTAA